MARPKHWAYNGSRGKMKTYKIIVERHSDGFVAYPLGLRGVAVGEGDTADEALDDVRSAIRFHLDTFGTDADEDYANWN